VTAVSSGTVVIQANNDGATGITTALVVLGGQSVGGIPVSWLLQYHLNPNDPLVAMEDPDRDGLTNLQEFQLGTDPTNPDTDGDGLSDGDEVNKYHTNPLLPDTDGDKIPDGVEIQTGTNPLDPNSYDLKKATAVSTVTPPSFTLATSITNPVLSVQLDWKVTLIDGKTTLDLTADPRTQYSSSNLNVCGFGQQPGLIFSGSSGTCVITISQNTLSAMVNGTVTGFSPTALSYIAIPGFANAVKVNGNYAFIAAGSAGLQVVDITDRTNPKIVGSLATSANANYLRIAGNTVYLATSSGLTIIDITNPLNPAALGSLSTPGVAWDVHISGTLAYVADGSAGLQIIDVSNPSAPSLVGSLAIPNGTAKGIDVAGNTAVIAASSAGVVIADVTTPSSPRILGSTSTPGDARKVAIKGTAAFIADYPSSMQVVDFSTPSAPVIVAATTDALGGKLQDITLSTVAGNTYTVSADVYFVNGVPIVNVTQPSNPIPVAILDFSKYRDDNGHGIDADPLYVYLTGEEGTISDLGTTGDTRLYIGQYRQVVDNAGIAPTVQITAPANGGELIQAGTATISVNATDDIAVASVNILINGQVAATLTAPPYQYTFAVPPTATSLVIGATAVDFGNNVGVAQNVQVSVIPDPGTTVIGKVVDQNGNPVAGATVSVPVLQPSPTSTTAADGSFSLAGISTISGDIEILAKFVNSAGATLAGFSSPLAPVRGGTTNAGTITIVPIPIITTMSAKSMLEGSQLVLNVTGSTLQGASWSFQPASSPPITLQVLSASQDGSSASLSITGPSGVIGTFALVASNPAGNSGTTANRVNRFTIVDPNSTADTDGDGFQDVIEAVYGTDPLDPSSYPTIRTENEIESVVFSVLNAPVSGALTQAESVPFPVLNAPFSGGVTEAQSVPFSVLNAPFSGAATEAESVSFSVLNAPVSGSGIQELESVPFSVLNAPIGSGGLTEADAYFSVCNQFNYSNCPTSSAAQPQTATKAQTAESTSTGRAGIATQSPLTVDPFADSDGDGLPDWFELLIGTDPNTRDTDADGLTDFDELFIYHTDPLNTDSDGDGFSDGEEVLFGSDPLNSGDTPLSNMKLAAGRRRNTQLHVTQGEKNGRTSSQNSAKTKAVSGAVGGSLRIRDTRPHN
jgi:hypothetical protein